MAHQFFGDRATSETAVRVPLAAGTLALVLISLFTGIGSMLAMAVLAHHRLMASDRQLVAALALDLLLVALGWHRYRRMQNEARHNHAASERTRALQPRDAATGLLSRRALGEQGTVLMTQGERRHKATAMILVDLGDLQRLQALHGSYVARAMVRQLGVELNAVLPSGALVAQLGDSSFGAAMLFDAAHPEPIEQLALKLADRLAEPMSVDGAHVSVRAAIGMARSDGGAPSIDALVRCAAIAATQAADAASGGGKRAPVWFNQSMERERRARDETEAALRQAIPRGEIVPYFEQQIDLATNSLSGFEVLARWEHPQRGLLLPEQFIDIAEESGLASTLSHSVMQQALAIARDWHPSLSLTFNVAPSQLRDPWFAQKLLKLLAETGYPAQRLEIDLTEAALFGDLNMAQTVIASLKNQGVRIALDDFGTGYSSIAHLRAIAFDRIKIDRGLVASIDTAPESAAIVTAIARLADSLNLAVTAEGVADENIAARARALGCDRAQGYRYGQPATGANTRRLLAERHLLVAGGAPTMPSGQHRKIA